MGSPADLRATPDLTGLISCDIATGVFSVGPTGERMRVRPAGDTPPGRGWRVRHLLWGLPYNFNDHNPVPR